MIQMVGIMVLCYFITLTIICLYHNHIDKKIGNIIFIAVSLIFFFGWNYAAYQLGWLKDGFMTLENISPFTMTLIPLTCLMSEKVRSYCNAAIAFLWVGMFLALSISPEHSYIFNYNHEATFIYATEASCHLVASLYGIYLIISGQVTCNLKTLARAAVCMYSVIGFGIFLNYVFHLDNFGMNPYGNYSIYMLDIFGSFEATLAAYLLGVLLVLVIGMQLGHVLNKMVEKINLESLKKSTDNTDKSFDDKAISENDENEDHNANALRDAEGTTCE